MHLNGHPAALLFQEKMSRNGKNAHCKTIITEVAHLSAPDDPEQEADRDIPHNRRGNHAGGIASDHGARQRFRTDVADLQERRSQNGRDGEDEGILQGEWYKAYSIYNNI